MNILITGGCGFIGSHLAENSLKNGHNVLVVDNLSTGSIANVQNCQNNPNFKLEKEDVLSWSGLGDAIKWADCVYHLAAMVGVQLVLDEPIKTMNTNISICDRLFKTMLEVNHKPRVFIASSSMVYGESKLSHLTETDLLHVKATEQGHWIYAISKLVDEALAAAYFSKHKIPVTTLRIFNTIGPRQSGRYGMVVPRFVQEACSGNDITVYGDGEQSRSFCDVRDLISIINLLVDNTSSIGEVINVGNDHEISINKLAELIKLHSKSMSKITHTTYQEAYGHEFNDILHRHPNLQRLYNMTGFKHAWTLEMTIDDLIQLNRSDTKFL